MLDTLLIVAAVFIGTFLLAKVFPRVMTRLFDKFPHLFRHR